MEYNESCFTTFLYDSISIRDSFILDHSLKSDCNWGVRENANQNESQKSKYFPYLETGSQIYYNLKYNFSDRENDHEKEIIH